MAKLLKLAPPPKHAIGKGNPGQWSEIERHFSFKFPDDYKQFIDTYGNGRFLDFFGFPSPFYVPQKKGITFEKFVRLRKEGVKFAKEMMPDDATEMALHPDVGGLFPIGYTDNGGTIFWRVTGDEAAYEIVCMKNGYTRDCDVYQLGLVTFIEKWLLQDIKVPSLTPPDLFPFTGNIFTPLEE